jgi:stage IV sporulation protein A
MEFNLYDDISQRTQGDIYIGVVGPVRTGKSTLIARMMDLMVLPNMEGGYKKDRVMDEAPQSGSGRTIMTTQPRFVPSDAAQIRLNDNTELRVRMVDCVGYMVKGALGTEEGEEPRMVRTPWFDVDIPFEEAAEVGTRKVIEDHSTIGVIVTTDGSIAGIPRLNYVDAEERVVGELRGTGKPFVIVLNAKDPKNQETIRLRDALEEKYDAPVVLLDVLNMTMEDVNSLLAETLYEFPLTRLQFDIPTWVQTLPEEHWLVEHILDGVRGKVEDLSRVRDYAMVMDAFETSPYTSGLSLSSIELGEGAVTFTLPLNDGLFYQVLGEQCGAEVRGEAHLMSLMTELVEAKREYDRVADALDSVRQTGYGLVAPTQDELTLEEPEIIKQGNRFGVKLKASAPSLHIVCNKQKLSVNLPGARRHAGNAPFAKKILSLAIS